ncbi:MAG: response regulator [Candidatus Omnitrophota bacterium]
MNENTKNPTPKKVLIVEDEPDLLDLAKVMLESAGFSAVTALDGENALEILKKVPVDLVVLDIVLPKIDGFSVFKSLRADINTHNIPVLIVSGRSAMKDTFLSIGADGFLAKPMEKDLLLQEVKNLTRNKALLLTESTHIIDKISRIFAKYDYSIDVAGDESGMLETGKKSKYKCVIAHLACLKSEPAKFKDTVANLLSYKDPSLVLYSDSSVKGLEMNSTVAIEEEIIKWTRVGVKNFYDSRVIRKPLTIALKEWLPEN